MVRKMRKIKNAKLEYADTRSFKSRQFVRSVTSSKQNKSAKLRKPVSDVVIYYDGGCGFCQRCILFLLKLGFNGKVDVQKQQSSTVRLRVGRVWYEKSTAVLFALRYTRYSWLYWFILIPRFIRDFCYDLIARYRQNLCAYDPKLGQRLRRRRY
jgi:predicted DCC family thiol-disulfide oxidoreductase YuxK